MGAGCVLIVKEVLRGWVHKCIVWIQFLATNP